MSNCHSNGLKSDNKNQEIDTFNTVSKSKSDTNEILKNSKIINYDSVAHKFVSGESRSIKLKFEKLKEEEFEGFKNNYNPKIYFDSIKTAKEGEFFLLNTSKAQYKFPCQLHCYYYGGYSPPL